MGRLVRDVELRQTSGGTSAARFTLAIDRPYTPRDGVKQTDFINCVAWRNTAEIISKYFSKGRPILVEGAIQTRTWEAQDGSKRYAVEVVVDRFEFVPRDNTERGDMAQKDEYTDIEGDEDTLPF
jgi:single-strand DNA-binding protein